MQDARLDQTAYWNPQRSHDALSDLQVVSLMQVINLEAHCTASAQSLPSTAAELVGTTCQAIRGFLSGGTLLTFYVLSQAAPGCTLQQGRQETLELQPAWRSTQGAASSARNNMHSEPVIIFFFCIYLWKGWQRG